MMQAQFVTELRDLKKALLASPPAVISPVTSPSPSVSNIWNDKQRVAQLAHTVVVEKGSDGKQIDASELEKICRTNGVSAVKTFTYKKSFDTGIVVNSKKDADNLMEHLSASTLSGHKTSVVTPRLPGINVVYLPQNYSKDTVRDMVIRQNPGIKAVFESDATEEKVLEIFSVSEMHSKPGYYKASIRLSNLLRSVIKRNGDKLFMGSQSCRVYDSIYVLRCYKCQRYGHKSDKCEQEARCGYCAGTHETRDCEDRKKPEAVCCANCKADPANGKKCDHEANSTECPHFRENQEMMKRRIPFYQKK